MTFDRRQANKSSNLFNDTLLPPRLAKSSASVLISGSSYPSFHPPLPAPYPISMHNFQQILAGSFFPRRVKAQQVRLLVTESAIHADIGDRSDDRISRVRSAVLWADGIRGRPRRGFHGPLIHCYRFEEGPRASSSPRCPRPCIMVNETSEPEAASHRCQYSFHFHSDSLSFPLLSARRRDRPLVPSCSLPFHVSFPSTLPPTRAPTDTHKRT